MILVVEAAMTAMLGLWMLAGVWDNWRFPDLNLSFVREVMRLARMEADYPAAYAQMAHRRIKNDTLIRLAFWFIVLWESLATVLLLLGAVMILLGYGSHVALAGALVFTANWAGFLIVGNYFCYYYCHFEGQFTHFLLAIWGSVVLTLLALG